MQGSKYKKKTGEHYNTEYTYRSKKKIYYGEEDIILITENDR